VTNIKYFRCKKLKSGKGIKLKMDFQLKKWTLIKENTGQNRTEIRGGDLLQYRPFPEVWPGGN